MPLAKSIGHQPTFRPNKWICMFLSIVDVGSMTVDDLSLLWWSSK